MPQPGLPVRRRTAWNKCLTPDRETGKKRDVLQSDRHLTPPKVEGVSLWSPPVDKCRHQTAVKGEVASDGEQPRKGQQARVPKDWDVASVQLLVIPPGPKHKGWRDIRVPGDPRLAPVILVI